MNQCPLKVDVGRLNVELIRDDDFANQITLLLARVINAVFAGRHELLEDSQTAIEDWHDHLPFHAYHESEGEVFPRIQMIQDCQGEYVQHHRRYLAERSSRRHAILARRSDSVEWGCRPNM